VLSDSLAIYVYSGDSLSSYAWIATGGIILGPADSTHVLIQWGSAGMGQVCVIESNDSCVGQPVCLEVVISDPSFTEEWSENDWLIYPNPSTGMFRLVTRDLSLRSYDVFDAFGKLVHSGSLQSISTEIDVTSLAAGHYMVRCGTLHKRIVIVR
jgi:hypothetical protein